MAEFVSFRLQIAFVVWVGFGADGDLVDDLKAVSFQTDDLFRVVCQKANLANAEIMEDLRSHAIVPEIGRKPQFFVGLDRIETFLLKFVGLDFCWEANPTTFLTKVEKDSSIFGDMLKRGMQLTSAVAAAGTKNIAGEAL